MKYKAKYNCWEKENWYDIQIRQALNIWFKGYFLSGRLMLGKQNIQESYIDIIYHLYGYIHFGSHGKLYFE